MILRRRSLTLLALVLAPGLLSAQQQSPSSEAQQLQNSTTMKFGMMWAKPQPDYDKMYEDIEIMRRILGRKLQPLYSRLSTVNVTPNPFTSTATPHKTANKPGEFIVDFGFKSQSPYLLLGEPQTYILASPPDREEILPSLEGVYLKGQGVIYTATLSSLQLPAKADADGAMREWRMAVLQRDTEWDSIRRQVRKDKEEPKKPEESKPPSLSDVLLKVLADNGHNFSQLGENESLTLVLTVHHSATAQSDAKAGTGAANKQRSTLATTGLGSGLRGKLSDLEMLGDLHQKQGRYEEALKAFQQAVDRKGLDPREAADLYRKLAQCYLTLDRIAEARSALEEAARILKNAQEFAEDKAKEAAAKASAAALPVKLIISAPKKLLDQVKEGKISFEDFRRQASVETLRFGDRR